MSDPVAIAVQSVSKAYRIWKTPAARVTGPLLAGAGRALPDGLWPRRQLLARATHAYRDFWALQDVSFELRRGESMGIIGRNGSGKSTLLQIIAGTLQPTEGRAVVHGRIAALLELGSGFNPEFTGRENVHLNATVLGLKREAIEARYDDIVRFAEIGDFIDQPVRTYSSGMQIRLAFAVAAHVNPDILIIDESLSVGDARFQLKCARAIDRFLSQGVTLLFVSHDAGSVKRLCRRALLLEHGRLIYLGRPNDVTNLYSKLIVDGGSVEKLQPDIAALKRAAEKRKPENEDHRPDKHHSELPASSLPSQASPASARQADALLADERAHVQVSGQEFSYGGDLGRILHVAVLDAASQAREWFDTGEPVVVQMDIESAERCPEPIFALTIKNTAGVEIYGTNTLFSRQPAAPLEPGEVRRVTFAFNLDLVPGQYFLSFGFTQFVGDELVVLHRRYDALRIEVHGLDHTFGIANLHAKIRESNLAMAAR